LEQSAIRTLARAKLECAVDEIRKAENSLTDGKCCQPFGGDRRRDRRSDGGRHRRQPAQGMISIASRRTMKSPYLKSSLASYRAASSEELDLAKSGGISATTERDRGFADSPPESDGFEPSVPRRDGIFEAAPSRAFGHCPLVRRAGAFARANLLTIVLNSSQVPIGADRTPQPNLRDSSISFGQFSRAGHSAWWCRGRSGRRLFARPRYNPEKAASFFATY
jgi:hypothetical protein